MKQQRRTEEQEDKLKEEGFFLLFKTNTHTHTHT